MNIRTPGQIEDDISKAITKFEQEYMGRGPKEVRTFLLQDIVFVRLKGVLTPAEQQLAKTHEGHLLIKQIRVKLLEDARELLAKIISDITGAEVLSMHTDISTTTGERVVIFTMSDSIDRNREN